MTCVRIGGAILTVADLFEAGGFTFEFNPYLGPVLLNRKGDPYSRQPGPSHPFWPVFNAWLARREAAAP
jgi:hypothetical protein